MTTAIHSPFVQAELTTTVYPDRSALAAYDGWHIVLAETDGDPEFSPMCGAWTSCPCYDTPELEMDARLRQKLGRWTAPVIDETDVPY